MAGRTRTATLDSVAELASALDYARQLSEEVGRREPLTICFIPEGLAMGGAVPFDADRVLRSVDELAALGVEWSAVALEGDTRDAQLAAIEGFGESVIDRSRGG